MKLELKSVKFYESMSEETNCFQADLFVNGKKVAYVKNDGQGGSTDYNAYPNMREQLKEAEAYALAQPEIKDDNSDFSFKSDLEAIIDFVLFENWIKIKEEKKREKNYEKGIVYGNKNCYKLISWKGTTLKAFMQSEVGLARVKKIVEDLKAKGETVMNTNLPFEI
jgi:hypothetical protein